MKIGVGGSRKGVSEKTVVGYLESRFRPDVTLVSGGAAGVDTFAETCWQTLGGQFISLRPVKVDDNWQIQRWEILDEFRVWIDPRHPTFMDFASAAFFRNLLIAEETDRGVAFWNGTSRGTSDLIDAYKAAGKPCAVHQS